MYHIADEKISKAISDVYSTLFHCQAAALHHLNCLELAVKASSLHEVSHETVMELLVQVYVARQCV